MQQSEEQEEKGAAVRRPIRKIAIIFFLLLIVVLLILQAPWKVLVLLGVVLASFTILPGPARKWFKLAVAVVVIALIIWVFIPDSSEGWRPYTFDKELTELKAKLAIPEAENAATIYNELVETYGLYSVNPVFLNSEIGELTMRQAWSSKDYPELAEWLKQQKPVLASLKRATQKAKCRYPVVVSPYQINNRMGWHESMRLWVYLLLRAGNNDIGEGRINEGLEKYAAVFQMAEHLYQQRTVTDLMVGIAIEILAIRQLNSFAVTGGAMEEDLIFIKRALAKISHDWKRDLLNIVECEKLLCKNIWGCRYEINREGKVRFSRNPLAALNAQFAGDFSEKVSLSYRLKIRFKVLSILYWFCLPCDPQKLAEDIDAVYKELYETKMARPEFNKEKRRRIRLDHRGLIERLTDMVKPAYYSVYELYQIVITHQRAGRLIVALRSYKNQHERWPERLDELRTLTSPENFVDPTNEGRFVYKLWGDEFKLYSKGRNNIDEDGRRSHSPDKKEKGPDDISIWPRTARETE
jgi:energy-coupling factor transporter transmembrane protein EcfT